MGLDPTHRTSACNSRTRGYTPLRVNDGIVAPRSAHRPLSAGAPPSRREPFDMAAHRIEFGKRWGAEAKRASARLRKARI